MLKQLSKIGKLRHLRNVYKNAEDIRIAQIILRTILGLFAAFLAVIGIAIFTRDMTLLYIILIGGVLLVVPIDLLFRGYLRLSSLTLLFIVVGNMTASAIQGQGIHDVAILTFPVAIFFANLILQRRDFFWSSFLILTAMSCIGIGEASGLFTPKIYEAPPIVDYIIVLIILVIAIMVADSLAENIRKNINIAKKEISLREEAQAELRYLNTHDELTGIFNRAFFNEAISGLERDQKYPVSFIFADIDNLKKVNDKKGHTAGDELLKRTSNTLSAAFRDGDILARIGGDEFVVILPQTDAEMANKILARLRKMLDGYNLQNPERPIHVSLGTSTALEGKLKNALALADYHMYGEKAVRK